MIIGLSGKKGSGKSTVAEYLRKRYDFEELAFATALKRACIEIFGLSEHQVFGTQEDKEKIENSAAIGTIGTNKENINNWLQIGDFATTHQNVFILPEHSDCY